MVANRNEQKQCSHSQLSAERQKRTSRRISTTIDSRSNHYDYRLETNKQRRYRYKRIMEKQETIDEMRSISQKLQSITTADANLNQNEYPSIDQTMPKHNKNTQSANSTQERKKNKFTTMDGNRLSDNLPGTNLPERIVFVVDTAKETDCTQFETRTGDKFSPLTMIKRVIEIFVNIKLGIQNKHEFALMSLQSESVSWVCDFTNNCQQFLSYLETIKEDHVDANQNLYDLGPCFEKIFKNTDLERPNGIATHVNRVILIYARSHSIPQFVTGQSCFDLLSKDSHFFVDCLYVHEPLSEQNSCQEVYDKLGILDKQSFSFILEVGRNVTILHTNMAKLTAHPLQRARQDHTPYSICNTFGSPQEVQTNV